MKFKVGDYVKVPNMDYAQIQGWICEIEKDGTIWVNNDPISEDYKMYSGGLRPNQCKGGKDDWVLCKPPLQETKQESEYYHAILAAQEEISNG